MAILETSVSSLPRRALAKARQALHQSANDWRERLAITLPDAESTEDRPVDLPTWLAMVSTAACLACSLTAPSLPI
jgi:hypothetical protein